MMKSVNMEIEIMENQEQVDLLGETAEESSKPINWLCELYMADKRRKQQELSGELESEKAPSKKDFDPVSVLAGLQR